MKYSAENRDSINPAPGDRVAAIGDVHGHLGEFLAALHEVGVRFPQGEDVVWPEDLWVVQLGDQVHKGPDTIAVLALRNQLVEASKGRYIDLYGNHEAQYVWGRVFYTTVPGVAGQIRGDGWRRLAVAVNHPGGDQTLLTHAGVTYEYWKNHCGSSSDAAEVAARLNRAWERRDPAVKTEGMVGRGGPPNFSASPLWAQSSEEVVASWDKAGKLPPFTQVAGHTNPSHPRFGRMPNGAYVDASTDHTFVIRGGKVMFSFIDPGATSQAPAKGLCALVLDEAAMDARKVAV